MKKLLPLIVSVLLMIGLAGILPIHGENKVYDSVLRLHVLANSDSEEDQALKLLVRDAILEYTAPLLEDAQSAKEAERVIADNIDGIADTARECLLRNGCDREVRAELDVEEYPTRNYESFCFPTGKYLSLRVMIGEAEGKNWWCVLFPPLCMSAATNRSQAEEAFISVGFTPDQYKVITETENTRYTVRFKILETIEEARRK